MLRGNERIFKKGFNILNKIERTNPPRTYVIIPPDILTPENITVRKKRESALISTFLAIVFTKIWYHVAMKKPNFSLERELWKKGIENVIGIDEVGRGSFAGPIVAAGVVFPRISKITKKIKFMKAINDSKALNAKTRKRLAKLIKKYAMFYTIEEVDVNIINKRGIGYANKTAFRKVVKNILIHINSSNFYLLSDGYRTKYIRKVNSRNHLAIIDGDAKSVTIAAASIIAKVYRDSLMRNLSKKYHNYKFSRNKGYGTKGHQDALRKYGLTEIHRTSFELSKFLSQ